VKSVQLTTASEEETRHLARFFSSYMHGGVLFLQGDLGVGKTTFSQALIRAAGFEGRVKSPTYTLVEPYELENRNIYHFDLYRLEDEEELLFLGCDEYFESAKSKKGQKSVNLCLIEWPEKASAVLPIADIELRMEHDTDISRNITIRTNSRVGEMVLNTMQLELQSFL
jgi:tRNA threonylcarbamoyladenosine biosynthesis protein TsaE